MRMKNIFKLKCHYYLCL